MLKMSISLQFFQDQVQLFEVTYWKIMAQTNKQTLGFIKIHIFLLYEVQFYGMLCLLIIKAKATEQALNFKTSENRKLIKRWF